VTKTGCVYVCARVRQCTRACDVAPMLHCLYGVGFCCHNN